MQEKRLFNNINKNTEKKNYRRFINEITNDFPLSNYSSLEPIRENIKKLFSIFTLYELMNINENEFNYWSVYVDKVVSFSKELGDIKLDRGLIRDIILSASVYLHAYELIDVLVTLYLPEKVDDFNTYIKNCMILTNTYFCDYCHLSKEDLDMGNEDLTRFYQKLCDISETNLPVGILRMHSKTIGIIFGYIHLNKIDNYDLLDEYFNNYQYISEKMELNNYKPYMDNKDNDEAIKYIFDNLDSFFTEGKKLIK